MPTGSKRRHVFISHHHQDDAKVTELTNLLAGNGHDIRNSSVRLKPENQRRMDEKRVSDATIARILRMKISWAGTVVVLIGKDTHTRPWVNWEIDKANEQGKRIVGVFLRGGTEADIPPSLAKYSSTIVKWNTASIMGAIDGATTYQTPAGALRSSSQSDTYKC
ncbi:TIR domain-containing protein [Hymenobacter segetis]|uniref:TIR domain-containing protein n=1 Tax=Hymenobacter segetis TaxID=2025509 RepID=A0ABU9M1X6_9BACT